MKLKPGDVCIIVNSYSHQDSLGLECVVISCSAYTLDPLNQPVDVVIHIPGVPSLDTRTGYWAANSLHLKKKPPKEKASTWDAVEKICGWSPRKVTP